MHFYILCIFIYRVLLYIVYLYILCTFIYCVFVYTEYFCILCIFVYCVLLYIVYCCIVYFYLLCIFVYFFIQVFLTDFYFDPLDRDDNVFGDKELIYNLTSCARTLGDVTDNENHSPLTFVSKDAMIHGIILLISKY